MIPGIMFYNSTYGFDGRINIIHNPDHTGYCQGISADWSKVTGTDWGDFTQTWNATAEAAIASGNYYIMLSKSGQGMAVYIGTALNKMVDYASFGSADWNNINPNASIPALLFIGRSDTAATLNVELVAYNVSGNANANFKGATVTGAYEAWGVNYNPKYFNWTSYNNTLAVGNPGNDGWACFSRIMPKDMSDAANFEFSFKVNMSSCLNFKLGISLFASGSNTDDIIIARNGDGTGFIYITTDGNGGCRNSYDSGRGQLSAADVALYESGEFYVKVVYNAGELKVGIASSLETMTYQFNCTESWYAPYATTVATPGILVLGGSEDADDYVYISSINYSVPQTE